MNCTENNDDDDEFGDSSIWDDFDVDAVVAANANSNSAAASLETPAKRQHDESCCKSKAIAETEAKAIKYIKARWGDCKYEVVK